MEDKIKPVTQVLIKNVPQEGHVPPHWLVVSQNNYYALSSRKEEQEQQV